MDIYDVSIKRLRADSRSPAKLAEIIPLPPSTIRDIKKGICKDPSFSTVRKIAIAFFPHERGRRIAA